MIIFKKEFPVQMDALSTWWNRSDKKEIFIQILVFFLFFGFSYEISGQLMGLPMGVAGIYILYDCVKRKSLEGHAGSVCRI